MSEPRKRAWRGHREPADENVGQDGRSLIEELCDDSAELDARGSVASPWQLGRAAGCATAGRASRRRDDRGAGSGLVAGGLVLLVALLAAVVMVLAGLNIGRQVRGAADLVAIAAARAQAQGMPGCEQASKVAEANKVQLDECTADIGYAEFVVKVRVSRQIKVAGFPHRLQAAAAAGYLAED